MSLFVFLAFLVVALFCFGKNSLAEEKKLLINEVFLSGGTGKSTNEFIELYNPGDSETNLKTLPLKLHIVNSSDSDSSKTLTFRKETIPANGYFLISSKDYFDDSDKKDEIGATYSTSGNSLVSNGALYISTSSEDKKDILDFIGLGSNDYFSDHIIINPKDKMSAERIDPDKDIWQESYILSGTPGKENSKKSEEEEEEEEEEEKIDYAGKLKINEILPAPKTQNSGKEFVEIVNISSEIINLSGMRIEDEKNHKVSFPEKTIAPKELFVLEGDFELNNTSPDSAFLIAKDGAKESPIDSVNYEKPKYDHSYAFDGSAWQWTSKVTKGAKNEFDKLLTGKIKKDKKIYANVYASFEVSADKKAKKFTWNFGDGHKSYLKKTRHKYEKSGTYEASIKITGDGKENPLNFMVEVEKFGKTKVQIISLSPNPKGKDSENEWIEILNNTNKKINLKNWSIATGWKKLANHPIKKDFILKAGEIKKLTHELCAFSLGNKQAKIELRYPDGKVADKIKYNRKNDSISEDELYQKEGTGWQWVLSRKNEEEKQPDTKLGMEIQSITKENTQQNNTEEPEKTDFDLSDLGKYSEDPAWREKQKTQTILLFAKSNIDPEKFLTNNQGLALGISIARFTHQNTPNTKTSDQFWKKINAQLNELILIF